MALFIDGIRVQVALRDDHQAQWVTNHLDNRVVFDQLGEFTKDGAGFGVLYVTFQGHHAFFLHDALQLADQHHQCQVVGLVPFGAFDTGTDATHGGFEHGQAVAHQRGANGRAANDDELKRGGLDDGSHFAAVDDVTTEHSAKHNGETNEKEHG
jgi:hypothetical protein